MREGEDKEDRDIRLILVLIYFIHTQDIYVSFTRGFINEKPSSYLEVLLPLQDAFFNLQRAGLPLPASSSPHYLPLFLNFGNNIKGYYLPNKLLFSKNGR